MSGEADDIVPLLRYLEHLRGGAAVSLQDEYEAHALADAWTELHPDSPAVVTILLGGRHVVSIPQ